MLIKTAQNLSPLEAERLRDPPQLPPCFVFSVSPCPLLLQTSAISPPSPHPSAGLSYGGRFTSSSSSSLEASSSVTCDPTAPQGSSVAAGVSLASGNVSAAAPPVRLATSPVISYSPFVVEEACLDVEVLAAAQNAGDPRDRTRGRTETIERAGGSTTSSLGSAARALKEAEEGAGERVLSSRRNLSNGSVGESRRRRHGDKGEGQRGGSRSSSISRGGDSRRGGKKEEQFSPAVSLGNTTGQAQVETSAFSYESSSGTAFLQVERESVFRLSSSPASPQTLEQHPPPSSRLLPRSDIKAGPSDDDIRTISADLLNFHPQISQHFPLLANSNTRIFRFTQRRVPKKVWQYDGETGELRAASLGGARADIGTLARCIPHAISLPNLSQAVEIAVKSGSAVLSPGGVPSRRRTSHGSVDVDPSRQSAYSHPRSGHAEGVGVWSSSGGFSGHPETPSLLTSSSTSLYPVSQTPGMISQVGERVGNPDSVSPHPSPATGEARTSDEPRNNTYGINGALEGGGALFGEGTSPGGHAPLLAGLGYTSSGPPAPVRPQPQQQHLFPVLPTRVERQWLPPLRIGVVVGGSAPSSGVHNVIVGLFHFLKHFTQQFPDCICRRGSRVATMPLAQGVTGTGAGTVLTKRQGVHPR
ncbi:phosphofructokinase domain-containing protein, partial [Cystoisospora suis]